MLSPLDKGGINVPFTIISYTLMVFALCASAAMAKSGDMAIYFGTFDPPHLAHLAIAKDGKRVLDVDKVFMVANIKARNKPGANSYEQRLAMTRALAFRYPDVAVVDKELVKEAFSQGGPHGWVTLVLKKVLATMDKDATLYQLMGIDSFNKFLSYKIFPEKGERRKIVVIERTGYEIDDKLLKNWKNREGNYTLKRLGRESLSSTVIRKRAQSGKSLKEYVPSVIEKYIARQGLYGTRVR